MKKGKATAVSVSRVLSNAGFSRSKKEGLLFSDGFLCNQFANGVRVDHCVYYKNYVNSDHINEIFDSYAEILSDYYYVETILTMGGDVRYLIIR